jgi:predicted transcriptional regulator
MLGSQQAKIIGILRIEYERNPKKFLTIKEIHKIINESNDTESKLAYNTIATILKRLSEQGKIQSYEESNRYFFQYKDIQNQVSDSILSMFIRAFGSSGLTNLIEKSKNLTDDDIQELMDLIDKND